MQPETVKRIKFLATHIFEKGDTKHFVLSWFGGEPLLYLKRLSILYQFYKATCRRTSCQIFKFNNHKWIFLTGSVIENARLSI